ncbi:triose-phosphate isomerase [Empedobacter sedimenti]|uniref:triose-phosphate isomerase n=1 Tax=Empedobacter sedimenti TaxID=3042610 RepID=UPI0024A75E51|nr:triose-phosphate isomerase [Empedobacter sedimenti]
MRDKIVAGNWKMNLNFEEAIHLATNLNAWVADNHPIAQVVIAPSSLYLQTLLEGVDEQYIKISSQDISAHDKGAYTGDVSAEQLDSIGLDFAIIGHSERREYQGETDIMIAQKLKQAFKYQINPILCVGEKLEEREVEKHFDVVKTQIMEALVSQKTEDLSRLIIAYEPVWAIGTGKTASPEQAQEIHAFIRKVLNDEFGVEVANKTSILYGGSINAQNANEIFAQPDIDGGLVGGASLKYDDFVQIISACK